MPQHIIYARHSVPNKALIFVASLIILLEFSLSSTTIANESGDRNADQRSRYGIVIHQGRYGDDVVEAPKKPIKMAARKQYISHLMVQWIVDRATVLAQDLDILYGQLQGKDDKSFLLTIVGFLNAYLDLSVIIDLEIKEVQHLTLERDLYSEPVINEVVADFRRYTSNTIAKMIELEAGIQVEPLPSKRWRNLFTILDFIDQEVRFDSWISSTVSDFLEETKQGIPAYRRKRFREAWKSSKLNVMDRIKNIFPNRNGVNV